MCAVAVHPLPSLPNSSLSARHDATLGVRRSQGRSGARSKSKGLGAWDVSKVWCVRAHPEGFESSVDVFVYRKTLESYEDRQYVAEIASTQRRVASACNNIKQRLETLIVLQPAAFCDSGGEQTSLPSGNA